jgi:hypothetical protein
MARGKPIGRQLRTDQLTITLAIQREKRVRLEREYHEAKAIPKPERMDERDYSDDTLKQKERLSYH